MYNFFLNATFFAQSLLTHSTIKYKLKSLQRLSRGHLTSIKLVFPKHQYLHTKLFSNACGLMLCKSQQACLRYKNRPGESNSYKKKKLWKGTPPGHSHLELWLCTALAAQQHSPRLETGRCLFTVWLKSRQWSHSGVCSVDRAQVKALLSGWDFLHNHYVTVIECSS